MNEDITLPIRLIVELLFGCDELFGVDLKSKVCATDFTPKRVRREVGVVLKEKDTDEAFIKVFVYDTHAEVWLSREWKQSNSRHFEVVKISETERQASLAREAAFKKVFYHLTHVLFLPEEAESTIKLATALSLTEDVSVLTKLGLDYGNVHDIS